VPGLAAFFGAGAWGSVGSAAVGSAGAGSASGSADGALSSRPEATTGTAGTSASVMDCPGSGLEVTSAKAAVAGGLRTASVAVGGACLCAVRANDLMGMGSAAYVMGFVTSREGTCASCGAGCSKGMGWNGTEGAAPGA
jgi:hypothetical protein